jgi:hypothetical protein
MKFLDRLTELSVKAALGRKRGVIMATNKEKT